MLVLFNRKAAQLKIYKMHNKFVNPVRRIRTDGTV